MSATPAELDELQGEDAPAPVQRRLPSRARYDWATVWVLASRDLVRFFRQRSRIVGALAQPLLFWVVIGAGFGSSFRLQGAEAAGEGVGYQQFFYPGVVVMVLLFAAISATMSVIDDRHQGFLQGVLAGPGSRLAIVLGKSLGSTLIALVQAALFLLLAPVAGVELSQVDAPLLAAMLVLSSLALTAIGFLLAWWIDSTSGYHAVMFIVLIPLWILSGAMFPSSGASPVMAAVMRFNPLHFAVEGTRRALYGDAAVLAANGASGSALLEVVVVAGFALAMLALTAWRVGQRR